MASQDVFYSQSSTRLLSQPQYPGSPHASETPPPPPPKPGSHNSSARGTPQIPQSPSTQGSLGRPLLPVPNQNADIPHTHPPAPSTTSYSASEAYPDRSNSTLQDTQPPRLPSPFLPDSLPSKSTADLAPILSDPSLLAALAATHPAHGESAALLMTALDTNLALASRLLTTQKHLATMREQTQQLLLQHTTLSTQWRRKQVEMDVALQPWSPKAMYGRLVSGIAEQEAIVRAVEESFLEKGGVEEYGVEEYGRGNAAGMASEREIGDWVKRIIEGTAVLERRRESRARWDEGRVGGWR